MTKERKKVLKMLDEGTIDVEEANELLSSLENSEPKTSTEKEPGTTNGASTLKILVVEEGEEKVNINLPVGLARFLNKVVPERARTEMTEKGIDLDKVIEEIESGSLDGKLVDIEDGDTHVEIRLGK